MNFKEKINKTAILAKLQFTENESKQFVETFEQLLDFISIIDELDIEKVAPLVQIHKYDIEFRDDKVDEGISLKEALLNKPSKDKNDFFTIPKVIS